MPVSQRKIWQPFKNFLQSAITLKDTSFIMKRARECRIMVQYVTAVAGVLVKIEFSLLTAFTVIIKIYE